MAVSGARIGEVYNRAGAAPARVGSSVSWSSFGTAFQGRVSTVFESGVIKPNQGHPGLRATQGSPVLEIEVYEQKDGGYQPSGRKIMRPATVCSFIGDLKRPSSYVGMKVNTKDDNTPAEIVLYSDITPEGWGGVSAKNIFDGLKQIKAGKDIDLRINSPGGDAFEGMAIHNLLVQHQTKNKCQIVAFNDGICASAATVVACGAQKMVVANPSLYMIHRGWTFAIGNRNDLSKAIELLDRVDNQSIDMYARRTGQDRAVMEQMVDAETWMSAEETVDNGFADEIAESSQQVAASICGQRPWFANLPSELKNQFSAPDGRITSRVPSCTERAEAMNLAVGNA